MRTAAAHMSVSAAEFVRLYRANERAIRRLGSRLDAAPGRPRTVAALNERGRQREVFHSGAAFLPDAEQQLIACLRHETDRIESLNWKIRQNLPGASGVRAELTDVRGRIRSLVRTIDSRP